MPVAGSYKGPGNVGLKTLDYEEIYCTPTFAKGTFGLEEGCSDNESFNFSHVVQGDWTKLGRTGRTSTAGAQF